MNSVELSSFLLNVKVKVNGRKVEIIRKHKKVCKKLKFNQYWKSDKTPSIIYVDVESFIKK